jgi:hypothetical protein
MKVLAAKIIKKFLFRQGIQEFFEVLTTALHWAVF